MVAYFLLIFAVIVSDQVSKLWMLEHFQYAEVFSVWSFFNLTLVFNEGAAFSFLSDAGGWQRWFFIALTSVVSVILLVWLLRLKSTEKLTGIALSLILGGAIGNLIDRVSYGYVVDFLDFHWQQMHWPAFNVADSAITIGVVLLLLVELGLKKQVAVEDAVP